MQIWMEIRNPEDYIVTSNSCNQAIVRLTSFAFVLFRSKIPVLTVWNQSPDTGLETITTKKQVPLMPQMFPLLDTVKSLSSPEMQTWISLFLLKTQVWHLSSCWHSLTIKGLWTGSPFQYLPVFIRAPFYPDFPQLLQPLLAIPKNTHSSVSVLSVSLVR